jgi:hypothetical protein
MGIYQTLNTTAGAVGISFMIFLALCFIVISFVYPKMWLIGRFNGVLGGIGMIVGGVFLAIALSKRS